TPFGHAGQEELNACMRQSAPDAGGFEHNLQSLRVVDHLEERYAEFDGLNLCFETREGILKHCNRKNAERLGDVGRRFLDKTQPSLEAQITNLADEIAYNNHDIDDGVRSGLITIQQLLEVEMFAEHYKQACQRIPRLPQVDTKRQVAEVVRAMINTLVIDFTETTSSYLAKYQPDSVDAVRELPLLAAFSPQVRALATDLKRFLPANLYRPYQVARMGQKAQRILRELFEAFIYDPQLLAPDHRR